MRMVTKDDSRARLRRDVGRRHCGSELGSGRLFSGPRNGDGVGRPWYGQRYDRYYDYNGPYEYYGQPYYDRPYRSERRYYRSHRWNWD